MNEFYDLAEDIENYCNNSTSYDSAAENTAKAIYEVAEFMANKVGLTGFQASYAMIKALQKFNYGSNKCGIRVLDMDEMLYSQYEYKFRTISRKTWDTIRAEAEHLLKTTEDAHPAVIEHWQFIANGNIPFGYKIKD